MYLRRLLSKMSIIRKGVNRQCETQHFCKPPTRIKKGRLSPKLAVVQNDNFCAIVLNANDTHISRAEHKVNVNE